MDRTSHGSRLLEFHRAHGINDGRTQHGPQPRAARPAEAPRHTPHGARPRPAESRDSAWAFPFLVLFVLLVWFASWLFEEPRMAPMPPDAAAVAEVAR